MLHARDPDPGVGTLVLRLRDDAIGYGRAQLDLVKAEVAARAGPAKSGAIFGVAAVILAIAALIALLVGCILILTPLIGPGGATAIVVLVTLAIAGVLGWLAVGRFRAAAGGGE